MAALLRDPEDANRPARWSHGVIHMLRNGFERLQVSNLRNHETPQERARSRRGKARGDAILNVRKHRKRRQPLIEKDILTGRLHLGEPLDVNIPQG